MHTAAKPACIHVTAGLLPQRAALADTQSPPPGAGTFSISITKTDPSFKVRAGWRRWQLGAQWIGCI
jgi:hypothetical protein